MDDWDLLPRGVQGGRESLTREEFARVYYMLEAVGWEKSARFAYLDKRCYIGADTVNDVWHCVCNLSGSIYVIGAALTREEAITSFGEVLIGILAKHTKQTVKRSL